MLFRSMQQMQQLTPQWMSMPQAQIQLTPAQVQAGMAAQGQGGARPPSQTQTLKASSGHGTSAGPRGDRENAHGAGGRSSARAYSSEEKERLLVDALKKGKAVGMGSRRALEQLQQVCVSVPRLRASGWYSGSRCVSAVRRRASTSIGPTTCSTTSKTSPRRHFSIPLSCRLRRNPRLLRISLRRRCHQTVGL